MSRRTPGGRQPLWIERFAEVTGVDSLADRIGVGPLAPHLFVTLVWSLEKATAFLAGTVDPSPVWAAGKVFELAGLLLVASTAVTLAKRYGDLAGEVDEYGTVPDVESTERTLVDAVLRRADATALRLVWRSDDSWIADPAPQRLRTLLLGCGLLLHVTYLFVLGNVEHVLATQGLVSGGLSFFVIIPFVYYPILAEFVAIIANVHIALPARIRSERLLDFEDISGYGGLRPVGHLIETSGRRYVAGLILYTLITIVTGIQTDALSGNAELVAVDTLYLVVGTLVGVILFFYPVFSLHRFMSHQKEARLHAIATDVSRLEGTGTSFPEVHPETPDAASEYMHHFMNLNVVKGMHEYPVKAQQVTTIVVGFVIPYTLEYGLEQLLASM